MKLGIIGAGQQGGYYATILTKRLGFPASDIIAYDTDQNVLCAFANKHVGVDTMITPYAEVDAAIVAVSTPSHADVIEGLVKAGVKHILCEKPLALNMREVERILRIAGESSIYTGLVVNCSPTLPYLFDLMQKESLDPMELYGSWGKPRLLDKNVRPSPGDVEDESIHPIGYCLSLIAQYSHVKSIDISARVGFLPFVDPTVQRKANVRDSSFPAVPNHMTSVRLEAVTSHGKVPIDVRSSFLLAKKVRQVGGILGHNIDPKPLYLFEVDFDQSGESGSEDVLTLVDLRSKTMQEERFKTDNLQDLTRSFLETIESPAKKCLGLAPLADAAALVKISEAILSSNRKRGRKEYVR